jgi:glycine cleavage system T protein (aminomethyltransferase)
MVKKSPLYEVQKKLNAKFTEFAGFEMPLLFSSIKDEHLQVRKTVGLFDVSHMSNVWITGPDAERLLTLTTIEDASRIGNNKSQYTTILRDDGTIIDDTIFMHLDDKFMIIPNAGMDEIVTEWMQKQVKKHHLDATIDNVSDQYVILAVQGPKSKEVLQELTDMDLSKVGFFACQYATIAGETCIISHTGYTGELGYELQISSAEKAKKIFEKIISSGKQFDIKPIGLGARDTLRLEKCFLLAGNEFEGGRSPLEAILSWAINWDHDFIGKEALLKQKEQGTYQRLTCLKVPGKGIPRHGNDVQKEGKAVGVVSSGTLSPCLNKGIAMAYVHPDYRGVGDTLDIMIRGKKVPAEIVKPPFVAKDWSSTQE